jgi:D-alanyl-D-alanine carboxypeptidase (penicillin-binding protein 5/6)
VPAAARLPGTPPSLSWPAGGSAAIGVPELGELGRHGDDRPRPIASVAKVLTALVVMADHPLSGPDDKGPAVAVTQADLDAYNAEKAEQSVVKVAAGEQLTERQLLEGMLVPSGNNFAEMLARWDAGSLDAFLARANQRLAALGMKKTHLADASGFSAETVSTAGDLVIAGTALMSDPVLSTIVSLGQVELPVAGVLYNVNYALGRSGLIGVKTGHSPQAGACFLFAAQRKVGEQAVLLIGAVLDQPTLDSAFAASVKLLESATPGLGSERAVAAADAVAEYRAPWGSRTGLRADQDVMVVTWPGLILHRLVAAPGAHAPLTTGAKSGRLLVWVGTGPPQIVSLSTDGPLFPPGRVWRLTRTDL